MINDGANFRPDFTPSNILLKVSGLDGLNEEQAVQEVGEPIQVKVTTETGESPTESSAPRYLVSSIDFRKVRLGKIILGITLIPTVWSDLHILRPLALRYISA